MGRREGRFEMSPSDLLNPERIIAVIFKVFLYVLAFLISLQLLIVMLCRLSFVEALSVVLLSILINGGLLFVRSH